MPKQSRGSRWAQVLGPQQHVLVRTVQEECTEEPLQDVLQEMKAGGAEAVLLEVCPVPVLMPVLADASLSVDVFLLETIWLVD